VAAMVAVATAMAGERCQGWLPQMRDDGGNKRRQRQKCNHDCSGAGTGEMIVLGG
jgi:hypothetical protein